MTEGIRPAQPGDAAAVRAIYAPFVRDTAVSFELTVPDVGEVLRRIAAVQAQAPWLVLERGSGIAGYAYAVPFRSRRAYAHTLETTVYVEAGHRRRGIGRRLMLALLHELRAAGAHVAVAGITLPNPGSVALHESLGFRGVGTFPEVWRKSGAWHDVGFWWKRLEASSASHFAERTPRA